MNVRARQRLPTCRKTQQWKNRGTVLTPAVPCNQEMQVCSERPCSVVKVPLRVCSLGGLRPEHLRGQETHCNLTSPPVSPGSVRKHLGEMMLERL